jgi:hypothetical protein
MKCDYRPNYLLERLGRPLNSAFSMERPVR